MSYQIKRKEYYIIIKVLKVELNSIKNLINLH